MLKWRSPSSGTRVVSHPHADLGHRGGAPEAALPGRRGALPQADRGPRAARADRGARGRAGAEADPGTGPPRVARKRRPRVRLRGAEPLAGGAQAGRPRSLLHHRRPAWPRPRPLRHAALARPDDAAPPARPRRAARAALPGPQDPGPRAVSLLVGAWIPSLPLRPRGRGGPPPVGAGFL